MPDGRKSECRMGSSDMASIEIAGGPYESCGYALPGKDGGSP
jgi:hypothetical protein